MIIYSLFPKFPSVCTWNPCKPGVRPYILPVTCTRGVPCLNRWTSVYIMIILSSRSCVNSMLGLNCCYFGAK